MNAQPESDPPAMRKQGLELVVTGVDLRSDSTIILADLTNHTNHNLDAIIGPAPAIVASGRQYEATIQTSTVGGHRWLPALP